MLNILDILKKQSFRVQPISQARKKEKQSKNEHKYGENEYVKMVRKELGQGENEWSA